MQTQLVDDMCEMEELSEQSILFNLTERYRNDRIFTYIGPTLLAVNPYQIIPQLFNQQITNQVITDVSKGVLSGAPHIYRIAGKAFHNMIFKEPKQSIIISGESGAGKTQSTKYCMQLLTRLSNKKSNSIQKKILACNPLLQAFGNSKTIKNQNSSRFGKYVQILFGKDNAIKGAKIHSYLLQKSRVTMVAKDQRNFHVFYALTQSKMFGVKAAKDYAYLRNSNCFTANNINDTQLFHKIVESFNALGFSQNEQDKIWRLLMAILDMGNLQFNDTQQQDDQQKPCDINDKGSIVFISQTLKISSQKLQQMLIFKIKKILKDTHKTPIKKVDCQSNRNTLCKAIYNSIFQFIIDKIQIVLSPNNQQDSYELMTDPNHFQGNYCEISILDIFGFQNFDKNSMEQICINFTNEKLLAQYNQKVFESQIAILKEDGLEDKVSDIVPPSNMPIICRLAEIFDIINEQTPRPQFTEANMIDTIRQKFQKNNEVTFQPTNKSIFKIHHSPCVVSYSIQQFKLKNQDELTPEINSVCQAIFPSNAALEVNKNNKTILKKFKEKIEELVSRLSEGTNHFVRCIKPNEEKRPSYVNMPYMKTQIKYLGVFETIKIRKAIFPFRKSYEEFSANYQALFTQSKGKTHREAATIILNKINASQSCILFGNNRVYMNSQVYNHLQRRLQAYLAFRQQKVIFIQRKYRSSRAWKIWNQKVRQKYLRIRTQKCEIILKNFILKKNQYNLFMGVSYIKIQSDSKKQIPKEIQQTKEAHISSVSQLSLNNESILDKRPYQFQNKQIQLLINNELIQRTENFEQSINQKQIELQSERTRLQRQKTQQEQLMTTCILELKQSLNQKTNQNQSLMDMIKNIKTEIEKTTLEINKIALINQIERSEKQQITEEKKQLQIEVKAKDKIIEDLRKSNSEKIQQLQAKLITIQLQNSKIYQQHISNQQITLEQKKNAQELKNKIALFEGIIKQYETIICQYKNERNKLLDEKSEMHKNILEKALLIADLRKNSSNGKNQFTRKDLQVQRLRRQLNEKQRELKQFYERFNASSAQQPSLSLKKHISQNSDNRYTPTSSELAIKNRKIKQLEESLQHANQKIICLQNKQKIANQKLNEYTNKHLKQIADFNNKINMANQKFNRDYITIKYYKTRIAQLEKALQLKDSIVNKDRDAQLSEGQIIHFLDVYQSQLQRSRRQQFKNNILHIFRTK